jgi:hypothetical protein
VEDGLWQMEIKEGRCQRCFSETHSLIAFNLGLPQERPQVRKREEYRGGNLSKGVQLQQPVPQPSQSE